MPDFFADLGLDLDCTSEDVRSAYKKLAKIWHPDKNNSPGAEEKFKQVLAAYTHLQSDDRRETLSRELRQKQQAKSKPKPPPTPPTNQTPSNPSPSKAPSPSQSNFKHKSHSSDSNASNSTSDHQQRPKSSKASAGTKQKNWWESFAAKTGKTNRTKRPTTSNSSRASPFTYMFFDYDNDLFEDIFHIAPEKPPPKPKPKTDPFGNKLPQNVDTGIYDWKSATKAPHQQPDYKEYLDTDTEFTCHYCGLMMPMDMLRKHEPRCVRLGGKKTVPQYDYYDENVNEAYGVPPTPGTSCKGNGITCQWCSQTVPSKAAAEHIRQCKRQQQHQTAKKKTRKPEWNNDFTTTKYDDIPRTFHTQRSSQRIDVNVFPMDRESLLGNGCLHCQLQYGSNSKFYCNHSTQDLF